MHLDIKASVAPVDDKAIADTFERLYGWKCFYCREMTKEASCPKCKKIKEEAKI